MSMPNFVNEGQSSGLGVIPMRDSQPEWDDKQIRSLDEIEEGMVVQEYHERIPTRMWEVISAPDQLTGKSWWMKIRSTDPDSDFEKIISLADKAIVPYPNGRWNGVNWLKRVE